MMSENSKTPSPYPSLPEYQVRADQNGVFDSAQSCTAIYIFGGVNDTSCSTSFSVNLITPARPRFGRAAQLAATAGGVVPEYVTIKFATIVLVPVCDTLKCTAASFEFGGGFDETKLLAALALWPGSSND